MVKIKIPLNSEWGWFAAIRYDKHQRGNNFLFSMKRFFLKKMGNSRPFFLYFRLFNTWLDLNRGPLESEATALPTESQPLPLFDEMFLTSFNKVKCSMIWVRFALALRPPIVSAILLPRIFFQSNRFCLDNDDLGHYFCYFNVGERERSKTHKEAIKTKLGSNLI